MSKEDLARAAAALAARRAGGALGAKVVIIGGLLFFAALLVAAPILTVVAGAAGDTGPKQPEQPSLPIDGDKQQLAAALMASGKLVSLPSNPDHLFEIQAIADGKAQPGCDIDVRVLQVLTLLAQRYDSIGISDLNRQCTGQIEGGGVFSSHWINGGGQAFDLWMLNGQAVTGADAQSIDLLLYLNPHMPSGTRTGQGQATCRGYMSELTNFTTQFDDACNHIHIDVAYTVGGIS
jgi:hypothetical protein